MGSAPPICEPSRGATPSACSPTSRPDGDRVATLRAVIFDYGGVLRDDGRAGWDALDGPHGLPPGALWSAFHDIPEYRLSRAGAIEADAFRAAIRRRLAELA